MYILTFVNPTNLLRIYILNEQYYPVFKMNIVKIDAISAEYLTDNTSTHRNRYNKLNRPI